MTKALREELEKRILEDLKHLPNMVEGDEQRNDFVDEIVKLNNIIHSEEAEKVKFWIEMMKLGVGVLTMGSGMIFYKSMQSRVFDFEENGRITSSPGKDLRLPKFGFKF